MIASFITALYLMGFITVESATTSLYIAGILLLVAEIGIVSFGMLAFNGIIALYAAFALQRGSDLIFGMPVGWGALFGIACVEIIILATIIFVYMWLRRQKTTTGTEAMIGAQATVIDWDGTKGNVRFEGELWQAQSNAEMDISANETVTIEAVNKMNLTITA